jgi:ribonucleoside-diphosphate reductase alpha chain
MSEVKEKSIQKQVEKKYTREEVYDESIKYFNGDELATEVWINKYCVKDKEGNYCELSPTDMHHRMAEEFSRVEKKYDIDLNGKKSTLSDYGQKREKLTTEKIFNYFDHFKYIIPQGSVMSVLGNKYVIGSLSNCIVIPEIYDSYGGIMFADQQLAQLMKRRCGVGADISSLRPSNMAVSNAAGTTTGAISFMERFSNTTREVAQSGRRGALMLTIDVKHPEAEHFAKIKQDLKKVTGANISIRLSDEFMKAVKDDKMFTQQWPIDSNNPSIKQEIKAKDLWNVIVTCARNSAEPGLIFWDKQHTYSTSSLYPQYKNISTNPCITDDSWIMTDGGALQVKDLIGTQFNAIINGKSYSSTDEGFYCTGKKKIYEITTNEGFKIKTTSNHLIKKISKIMRHSEKTEWTETSKLLSGDLISLNNHENLMWDGEGNREKGWLLGSLIGDGTFNKKKAILNYWGNNKIELNRHAISLIKNNLNYRVGFFGEGSEKNVGILNLDKTTIGSAGLFELSKKFNLNEDKKINIEIEKTSSEFYAGFLSGWFDADGTVIGNQSKGVSVRLSSSICDNLYAAQRMLARLGIISTVYTNRKNAGYKLMPNGKGGEKEYWCKSQHELVIANDNIIKFRNIIGFFDKNKIKKLDNLIKKYKRTPNRERFVAKVKEIKEVGEELVYDCTIPKINEFDANGISVHNCSEIAMGNDSCRLIAMNMFGCVENPFTKDAKFNFDKWYEVVYEAQRLMDNLVDLELERIETIFDKIASDPEPDYIKQVELQTWKTLYENGKNGRRTGLGFTALADTMAALNLKFDSEKSLSVIEKILKKKCEAEFDSSIDMSIERGCFVGFDLEIENKSDFVKMIEKELPHVYERMMKFGRRNVSISTVAPNGSLSIVAQTSSGIEPVYMLSYMRRRKINPTDKNARVDFTDSMGDKWQEYEIFHPMLKKWMEITGETDKTKSPYFGATAEELDWIKRVKIQSIVQKYITHSISSCLTFDSLILTSEGLLYLDEVFDFDSLEENKFEECKKELKIKNHIGDMVNIGSFYNNGKKPVFKISLKNGLSINATGNEKFLVLNEELGISEWKMLSEIEKGERIKIS